MINPKLRVKFGEPIGAEIFFAFPEIYDNEKTYLEADVVAGTGSISANGVNFAVDQYVVIGRPGSEKTEIIKLHASTTPTSSTITFASNLQFPHSRGDIVQFIPYNQITPERSTDAGVNYTPLTAVDIRADASETYLQRPSDASTDVYKFRFTNSTAVTNSGYSDPVTATGYAANSVYSVKKRALQQLHEKKTDVITDEFLNDSLDEARRIVDMAPGILRWSFRTSFDTDIGTIIAGRYSLAVPSDLRDANTHKNLLSVRVGRRNMPCRYQDENDFRQNYYNVAHSTLNGAITTGSTSIILTSSGDFDESGTIDIAAEDVTTGRDAVAYTANNESTNTLSGVTGIQAAGHATTRDVWQNATFGLPTKYTINNGFIYFDVPFGDDIAGENIYSSYYKTLTAVNSDSDLLDEPFYDLYTPYLKWKIKNLKAGGKLDAESDGDYKEFQTGLALLVGQEIGGQRVYFVPS